MNVSRSSGGQRPPLDKAWIRSRLVTYESPRRAGDVAAGQLPSALRPAAVLLVLVGREEGPTILLTQRTMHLRDHAGQISLPGGRIEASDASEIDAALREAKEEIGLEASAVEILGRLPFYDTTTGYRIHPIVGWATPPIETELDPFEVAELFELPLCWLLERGNHQRGHRIRDGVRRQFWILPYRGYNIWGATAAILVHFAGILSPEPE